MEHNHLAMQFDPALVVLSWLVAIFAAYSAVSTIDQLRQGRGGIWLAAGSLAFGAGVWTMHFIGMKAVNIGIPFSFDLLITAASVLVSTAGAAVAFPLVAKAKVSFVQLLLAGTALGSGIGGMHYLGMAGMYGNFSMSYDFTMLAVSVLVAVTISSIGLGIMIARALERFPARNLLVAAVVGAAVPLMHYVGMYAIRFSASGETMAHSSGFFNAILLINVFVVVAIILMALPLFASSLVQTQNTNPSEVES